MTRNIFLSYRRDDSKGFTNAIYTLLELHFPGESIFMDVDTLIPGSDFVKSLEDAVGNCDVFLAIIGPSWENIQDSSGSRRLDNPEDFVRIEIAHALKRGIPVIPVLVDGAQMPLAENLPENIKDLARRHAFSIGDHMRSDVERLAHVLERTFQRLDQEQGIKHKARPAGQRRSGHDSVGIAPGIRGDIKAGRQQERPYRKSLQIPVVIKSIPAWILAVAAVVVVLIGYIAFSGLPNLKSRLEAPAISESSEDGGTLDSSGDRGGDTPSAATEPSESSGETPSEPDESSASETPVTSPGSTVTTEISEGDVNPTSTLSSQPVGAYPAGTKGVNPMDEAAMLYVPPSEFLMGRNNSEEDEDPEHLVYVDDYWIYQTEVTNAMWGRCVRAGGCEAPDNLDNPHFYDTNFIDHPVVNVNWEAGDTYCRWAGGRLPTEAEWERAARGVDGNNDFPWGSQTPSSELANYNGDVGDTRAVGSYPLGDGREIPVMDMAGNVAEWVNDWYDPDYYYISPTENPMGPESGIYKILRGGGWNSTQDAIRVTYRQEFSADFNFSYWGFRCVLPDFDSSSQN